MLVSCSSVHFSHVITELKIRHLYYFITHMMTSNDSANPSSMQDACHICLIAQWIECPPSVREVMGFISVGDSDFFFVPRSNHIDQFILHIIVAGS